MQIDLTDTLSATEQKEAFAFQLLICHGSAMRAAEIVAPDNMPFRLHIIKYWANDPYVVTHKKTLVEKYGAAFFLPDKHDIAHRLMEIADRAPTSDDKLKALKQFADLMGMSPAAGAAVNVNNVTVNKVMVVESHGSDEEWEARAITQQRQLTIDNVKS